MGIWKTNNILKPAILEKAVFVSSAALPVGNLINRRATTHILSATSLIQRPAVDLEMFKLSPIKMCMDPVARNRKHRSNWRRGGRGQFLFVGRWTGKMISNIYMVGGRKRYLLKTSSGSRSSKGLDLSRNNRGLLAKLPKILLCSICRLICAAILNPESDVEQAQVLAQDSVVLSSTSDSTLSMKTYSDVL